MGAATGMTTGLTMAIAMGVWLKAMGCGYDYEFEAATHYCMATHGALCIMMIVLCFFCFLVW